MDDLNRRYALLWIKYIYLGILGGYLLGIPLHWFGVDISTLSGMRHNQSIYHTTENQYEWLMAPRRQGGWRPIQTPAAGMIEDRQYYFDMDGIRTNLKNSTLFFLGHSRCQFGFSRDALETFFAAHGIKFHFLCFGLAGIHWPMEILEKQGIQPGMLVLNVDQGFFDWDPHTKLDLDKTPDKIESWWLYRISLWQLDFFDWINDRFYRHLWSGKRLAPTGLVYASEKNGMWDARGFKSHVQPKNEAVSGKVCGPLPEWERQAILSWKTHIKEAFAKPPAILLIQVPAPRPLYGSSGSNCRNLGSGGGLFPVHRLRTPGGVRWQPFEFGRK
ncbi:MAG: hypothetical protein H7833_06665 [Magnetococcus sp. DMHC-1]